MKKGAEFELFIKAIYEEILAQDEIENITVKHDIKIKGKSGQSHQVDVYWEFKIANIIHRVAVECKDYKRTISVGKLRDFFGALNDIGNIQGIFVTTKGYQSGAIKFADHNGIALKIVKEPTEKELQDSLPINTLIIKGSAHCIAITEFIPLLDIDWIEENTDIREGDNLYFSERNDQIKIIDHNFELLGTILDFENKLPREPHNTKSLSHKYEFKNAFIHVPNWKYKPLKIKGILFRYDTYTLTETLTRKLKLMAKAVLKDIITGEIYLYNKYI